MSGVNNQCNLENQTNDWVSKDETSGQSKSNYVK